MAKEEICSMFPRLLYVEPTNFCKSRCYMCPASVDHREKGFMSLARERPFDEEDKWLDRLKQLRGEKGGFPEWSSTRISI